MTRLTQRFLRIAAALYFLLLLLVNLLLELLDFLGESAHPLGIPLLQRLWGAGNENSSGNDNAYQDTSHHLKCPLTPQIPAFAQPNASLWE